MAFVPRVAAVHDLSCFGRCSLTVVMPVLSAMGVQCCPLPTAVLSTHTGGFEGIARTDLTGQMAGTLEQWQGLGLTFEGTYVGYLSSPEQAALAAKAMDMAKFSLVDPVLGDHGRLYRSITPELTRAMTELCDRADVITPNLTEAALILGVDMADLPHDGEKLARSLSGGGTRSVVVTGVSDGPVRVGCAWFDRESGATGLVMKPRLDGQFHGTGDIFASVLTGALTKGKSLPQACEQAAEFVLRCIGATPVPTREGVAVEAVLPYLMERGEER